MAHRRGFTLVEMLIVVSLIMVLIGMLLPSLHSGRESARRSICQSNIHNLVMGQVNYAMTNGGRLMSSQVTTGQPGLGGYAVYGTTWPSYQPMGKFRAHGYLAFKAYVTPRGLYCPSWTHPMNYHSPAGSGGGWASGSGAYRCLFNSSRRGSSAFCACW